ncbi:hypothetical protein JCM6882_003130 [Rhodosporidiobolus microsporus]
MSTTIESGECAVCAATTSSRCSACNVKFFCSREHQKLLWPTHKWLCDKDPSTFVLPPLTNADVAVIEGLYAEHKAGKAPNLTRAIFESWEKTGLKDLPTFIKGLGTYPNPELRQPLRVFTLLQIYILLASASPDLPSGANGSPWIFCGVFLGSAMVDFAALVFSPLPVEAYICTAFTRLKVAVRDVQVEESLKAEVNMTVEKFKGITKEFFPLSQREGTLGWDA